MKNFKRWIALLVIFSMVSGLGIHQYGSSFRANEINEPEVSQVQTETNEAVDEEEPVTDEIVDTEEQTEAKSVKTDEAIVSEAESSGEPQTQESTSAEKHEVDKVKESKKTECTISIKEPEKDGGSVFVWTGGNKKQISFNGGIYKESVEEGMTFHLQIKVKEDYQVEQVTDQNGSTLEPIATSGNTYSYEINHVASDNQIGITYKKAEPADEKSVGDKKDNKDESKAENTETNENNKDNIKEENVTEKDSNKSAKPSQTLKATTGGAVITVTALAGTLPEGATVKAIKVNSLVVENSIKNAVKNEGQKLVDYEAYDITIYDKDGRKIQPDDSVKVAISGVNVRGEEKAIYHIDSNGVEKMDGMATGNTAVFNAEQFSIYVVGGTDAAGNEYHDDWNSTDLTGGIIELAVGNSITIKCDSWHFHNWKITGNTNGITIVKKDGGRLTITVNNNANIDDIVRIYCGNSSRNYIDIKIVKQIFVLTFDANGGENPPAAEIKDIEATDKTIILPEAGNMTRTGYEFKGWSESRNGSLPIYKPGDTWELTANKTLYAVWVQNVTLTFDANGGDGGSYTYNNDKFEINNNGNPAVTLPEPLEVGISNEDKIFIGWSTDNTGGGSNYIAGIEYAVDWGSTTTLYAIWLDASSTEGKTAYFYIRKNGEIMYEPAAYPVSAYIPAGAGTDLEGKLKKGIAINNNLAAVKANIDKEPSIDKIKRVLSYANIDFNPNTQEIQWYVIKKRSGTTDTWNVDGVIRDKAKYSVTYDTNGGNTNCPGSVQYSVGAEVNVSFDPSPSRAGYTFLGWSEDKHALEPTYTQNGSTNTFTMPEKNVILYAVWKQKNSVRIFYQALEGGTVIPEYESLNPETGTAKGSIAKANAGYTFDGWYNDANCTESSKVCETETYVPNRPVAGWNDGTTYYAKFTAQDANIIFEENGGSEVEDKKGVTDQEIEDRTMPTTERAGYTFAGWYDNDNLAGDTVEQLPAKYPAGTTTYYAKWTVRNDLSYTVHYYWNGTQESVHRDKIVENQTFGKTISEAPIEIENCTPVSDSSKSITINEDKNEIIFYYYKNVSLKANSDEVVYNGNEQIVSGFSGVPDEVTFADIFVEAKGIDVGTYNAEFANDTVGKTDSSNKYIVTQIINGTLKIDPREVTIKGNSAEVTYTGMEQKVEGYEVGENALVADHEIMGVSAIAKGTEVGVHEGSITEAEKVVINDENGNPVTGNYTIKTEAGKLTITKTTEEFEVILTDKSYTYDAKGHSLEEATTTAKSGTTTLKYATKEDAEEGEWVESIEEITRTNVGTTTVYVKAANPNYVNEATARATLKIDPREVTIKVDSKAKFFEEKDPTFTGNVSGKIADDDIGTITYIRTNNDEKVGTYKSVLTAEVTNENSNYIYTVVPADFTISKANSNIATITSATEDLTKFYDGNRISIIAKADKSGSTLLYSIDGTKWSQNNPGFANAGTYTVYVKATNDNFEDTPVVSATIVINPRTVVIRSANASKTFDGNALTSDKITVSEYNAKTGEGFIEGEGANYNVTGAQTEVGSSDNTFEYTLKEGTIASNYSIVVELGTLTVVGIGDNPIVTPGGNNAPPVTPATVIRTMTGAPPAVANIIGGTLQRAGTRVSELVVSEDDEVPLANMKGEHRCCIFHFLLMLVALILLAIYTRNMKNRQEEIFKLRRQIDEERAAQGFPLVGKDQWKEK